MINYSDFWKETGSWPGNVSHGARGGYAAGGGYSQPAPTKTASALAFEARLYETRVAQEPTEFTKNSVQVVYGDGLWLWRKNKIGVFSRKIKDIQVAGLPVGPAADFKMALPKIPVDILQAQVCFYRKVMAKFQNAEAYTMIFWDMQDQKYVVGCPKQLVSKGNVTYDLEKTWPADRYLNVVSCHSHNTMAAFYSSTDDADEKGDMLYMVMGTLDRPVPTFKIRANVFGGQARLLELGELFDTTDAEFQVNSVDWDDDSFPQTWMGCLNIPTNGNQTFRHHSEYQQTRTTPTNWSGYQRGTGSGGVYEGSKKDRKNSGKKERAALIDVFVGRAARELKKLLTLKNSPDAGIFGFFEQMVKTSKAFGFGDILFEVFEENFQQEIADLFIADLQSASEVQKDTSPATPQQLEIKHYVPNSGNPPPDTDGISPFSEALAKEQAAHRQDQTPGQSEFEKVNSFLKGGNDFSWYD